LKRLSFVAAVFVAVVFLLDVAADKPRLPKRYMKWLDEDVAYIITPVERDVFLKLQTDKEGSSHNISELDDSPQTKVFARVALDLSDVREIRTGSRTSTPHSAKSLTLSNRMC
jgi:hypothetical protein